jgi:hypothetical protein
VIEERNNTKIKYRWQEEAQQGSRTNEEASASEGF